MTAAGTIAARPAAGSVPAEMVASLANMLESALAAGPLPGQEARGDAGRGEEHLLAPGPDRGDLPAPVHADAGPRARRVHRPAVRPGRRGDRKSTRLNSSHTVISYAVFCLKKKKIDEKTHVIYATQTHISNNQ